MRLERAGDLTPGRVRRGPAPYPTSSKAGGIQLELLTGPLTGIYDRALATSAPPRGSAAAGLVPIDRDHRAVRYEPA